MTIQTPAYSIGDVVYIKESAAIGSIEAVTIGGASLGPNNRWIYTLKTRVPYPYASTYGDRVSLVNSKLLYFTEDEFVTHYDALVLAEAAATARLTSIQSQLAAYDQTG